jgi:hypothetical protein
VKLVPSELRLRALVGGFVDRELVQLRGECFPSVPTSPETVPSRYPYTDGRRMVPQTCPSQPKFLVERSSLPRTSASSMSPA